MVAVLALTLAPAGVAHAQIGGPSAPSPLTQPEPPPPVDTGLDDEGLTSWQQALIFVAAGVVLAGIGFVIVRDARRAAPVEKRSGKGGGRTSGGGSGAAGGARAKGGAPAAAVDNSASAARARERQQAKRAKAKAKSVREQRKRNRPR
jgi:hypothetical protein